MKPHLIVILSVTILSVLSEHRLPDNVVPKRYDVELAIRTDSVGNAFYFNGKVCIDIKIEGKTIVRKIQLHGRKKNGDLKLITESPITINNIKTNAYVGVLHHKYDEKSDILTIETFNAYVLEPEESYKLCILYHGKISKENGYVVWRKDDTGTEYFIATNFQRQSAFPCFDEPNMTATFKIQLNVQYGTGYPYPKTYSNDHTKKTTKWLRSPSKMLQDTYIIDKNVSPSQISFVVTNMKCDRKLFRFSKQIRPYFISCSDESNQFKNVPSKGLQLNMIEFSLAFSDKYPNTIHFIVVPTNENLISWKMGLVLISKEEVTDPSDVNRTHNVMIRLTSQLFGGMITPDSWESNWLFTALAKYCAYLQNLNYFQDRSLMMELPSNDLEMNMKGVDIFQEQIVGESKGFFILQMIYSVLGKLRFEEALQYFSECFLYKPAGPQQLWETFDRMSGVLPDGISSWSEVIEKWTTKPSYPLVTVTSLGDGKFEVTQEYFNGIYDKKRQYELNESKNNGEELCWIIPFSFSVFDGSESKIISYIFPETIKWLDCNVNKKTVIDTEAKVDQLVLFNNGYKGLYRVKYDETSLEKIVKTLETSRDSIRPIARAQLVHDALTLAWMGYQDYKHVFSLLKFLIYEESDIVWKSFFSGVFNLNEILKTTPDTYVLFQNYVKFIMTYTFVNKYGEHHIFNNLMEKEPSTITPMDDLFNLWACNVAHIDMCRLEAGKVYDFWMSKDDDEFFGLFKELQQSTSLFYTTLCTLLNNINHDDEESMKKVDFFFDKLMYYGGKNIHIKYQEEYINVLECISDSSIVNRLLDNWMSPYLKPMIYHRDEHKVNVFLKLIDGPHTFLPTLKRFYIYINEIMIKIRGTEVMAKFVRAFTSKMKPDQISKMKAFVEAKPELKTKEVLQAIEEGEAVANQRAEWLEKNDLQIRTALQTFLYNDGSQ